jgi:dihydroorotate dehydrogenase
MPDWSYRTVFRPLFFCLPAAAGRDLCLGFLGTLCRLPLGSAVIDFLGHMRPPTRLNQQLLGITFPTPVGLGPDIDVHAAALPALARFGLGFIEVGPVTDRPVPRACPVERRPEQQSLHDAEPAANPGVEFLAARLAHTAPLAIPLLVRLGSMPGSTPEQAALDCSQVVRRLAPYAQAFSLTTATRAVEEDWAPESWRNHVRTVLEAVRAASLNCPFLLCLPPNCDPGLVDRVLAPALELGVGGVLIDGGVLSAPTSRLTGPPAHEPARALIHHLRQSHGDRLVLIAAGGIHEPAQALDLLRTGANLVQIDSGLVYSGPGLPKRINEALLYAEPNAPQQPSPTSAPQESWFWTTLMGTAMFLGGILALAIASTRVVLPYDETMAGMSREQLAAINDRLLAFMAHDRVSLAGTMIAVGILYLGLSLCGIRRGAHWALVAILTSAFAGFASFFTFLGFGYFDPFHAFVTAVLFQFLLLALHAPLPAPSEITPPSLYEDWRWRRGQWGQLLTIAHGAALVLAGAVISTLGSTTVFVPEDLDFMRTTAEALSSANPRLVPLVAHDRASFGGMILATGLGVLLTALWGYRQGYRWLWWTLLGVGVAGYVPAIVVHFAVGYCNWRHLAPACAGASLCAVGLILSYPYLCQPRSELVEAWREHQSRAGRTIPVTSPKPTR